jgi:hypothetical protein
MVHGRLRTSRIAVATTQHLSEFDSLSESNLDADTPCNLLFSRKGTMLPIFVGVVVWIGLLALLAGSAFVVFRRLRKFAGFVFLTPTMGVGSAFVGFLFVGWLLDGHLRPEIATSIAFYLGFLLCGALGSLVGFISGFWIWWRISRVPEATYPHQSPGFNISRQHDLVRKSS